MCAFRARFHPLSLLPSQGSHDFKVEDFFAGPADTFDTHYGVGGRDGDGNVFSPDNIEAFARYVKENTDGAGVHFMMADGGFSVEGNENIQASGSGKLHTCNCESCRDSFVIKVMVFMEHFEVY